MSSSAKSTSSEYSHSVGTPRVDIGGLGLPDTSLRWFKAPASTSVNSFPERLSPWNAPSRLSNSSERELLTRMRRQVFAKEDIGQASDRPQSSLRLQGL